MPPAFQLIGVWGIGAGVNERLGDSYDAPLAVHDNHRFAFTFSLLELGHGLFDHRIGALEAFAEMGHGCSENSGNSPTVRANKQRQEKQPSRVAQPEKVRVVPQTGVEQMSQGLDTLGKSTVGDSLEFFARGAADEASNDFSAG